MQQPHVRETIADRELETWVLARPVASLDFGTALCEKRDLAVSAAAAVGFLTARTGNRIGAVLLAPDGPVTVPARGGKDHLMAAAPPHRSPPRRPDARHDRPRRRHPPARRASPAPGPGRRRVRLPRRRPTGSSRSRRSPPATRCSASRSSTPRARAARRSACSSSSTPDRRPRRDPDREPHASASATRPRPPSSGPTSPPASGRGAEHLLLRTDRDWLLDLVRFVARRRDRIWGRAGQVVT